MANYDKLSIRPSKAPNLPVSPVDYSQHHAEQHSNALRLYFNQVDNANQRLVDETYSQLTMLWLGGC